MRRLEQIEPNQIVQDLEDRTCVNTIARSRSACLHDAFGKRCPFITCRFTHLNRLDPSSELLKLRSQYELANAFANVSSKLDMISKIHCTPSNLSTLLNLNCKSLN